MKDRILELFGGWRRRSLIAGSLAVLAGGVFAISALGVHDEAFQLDGDVLASTQTNVGGTTQTVDWNSLFNASGGQITPLPTGFTATTFDKDFTLKTNGSFEPADTDIFTTGSKDELAISGWQCKATNNVTDKNDIMNAYATAYTATNGEKILYFALEKNDNTGTNDVGFWFLQDGTVNCNGAQGTTTFTGAHADGDLLVVSEFTNGGVVSTIKVYRWNGGANGSLGVANPIADGVDCENTSADDEVCATVNRPPDGATLNGTISTPWPTADKSDGPGNTLRTGEFFEGGLNLSKNNLADRCFNTFLADTRASASTTADLEDFSRGSLGGCNSTTVTTPTPAAGWETVIPANAQVTSSDSALISVTGVSQFDGTVTFSLCGPLALDSTANCQTGGVQISTTTLDDATNPATVNSGPVTLTSVGKYCWRAVYSGDPARQVPGSSDPNNATNKSECFRITPRTPTLTTCAGTYSATLPPVCTPAGTVDFGQPVIDRANLTGTANRPGTGGLGAGSINPTTPGGPAQGTITFKLYGPDAPGSTANCNTLAAGFATQHPNGIVVNVNGDGVYGPVSFTPTAPGVYHWKASYSGDSPNTNPSGEANTNCNDTNEDVVVRQIPTDIMTKQSWFPNDTATITSTVAGDNLGAGGTVDFSLHPSADCTGAALYAERQTLTGGSNSEEVATHNDPGSTPQTPGGATVTPYRESTGYGDAADSIVGPNSWKVVYTPAAGDTAHLGSQSACTAGHTEKHAITYTNDPGGPPNP